MKKFIAIVLILLVGLFMVSSCGSSEPETKEQGQETQPSGQQPQQEEAGGGLPRPPEFP
jgi:ABC-type Fe3+-citrate transport system substrate-binding protein